MAEIFPAAIRRAVGGDLESIVRIVTHNTRVDAQRFYMRLGFQPSHVGMTIRF
jgi:ribosomal protein S18 acetylase RimI-like enzyme